MSLAGRRALVTGSSRGIGRAIALGLAAKGCEIAVNYRRDRAAADAVVAEARALGVRAEAFQGAVERWDDCVALVRGTVERLGPPDILVNNAGVPGFGRNLADAEVADMQSVMAVNALGAFYLSKLCIPELRRHERSDIIFIGSTSAALCPPMNGIYSMAKAAVGALSQTLAKEERGAGMRVNTVAPTLTASDMGNEFAPLFNVRDLREIDATSPFGRVCLPEDIAAAVTFLVSPDNFYISGQILTVDGATGGLIAGAKVD